MGSYRELFHPEQLININEDGCNNFARAYCSVGKGLIDHALNTIRKMTERCDCMQGFFLLHSHGGGTGSGFTSLILKCLNVEFAKSPRLQLSVFPSPVLMSSVVEPYNCILSSTSDIEQSDITTLVNNEAIYGICNNLLNIPRPTFSNINRVITRVFSDLTVALRFESSLSSDFAQMSTNLIPYPRIHFPLVCHSPLVSGNKAEHDILSTQNITRCTFDTSNQLITCDPSAGLYMSCVMQYRGNVTPKDVNEAIFEIKRRQDIKFVDWCPTGFKVGICSQMSPSVTGSEMAPTDRSLTMVSSTTSIVDPMEKILSKFSILLNKRAFVFWFVGEGMEEGEFIEAGEEISNLILDYMELASIVDNDSVTEDVGVQNNVKQTLSKPVPTTHPLLSSKHSSLSKGTSSLKFTSLSKPSESKQTESSKNESSTETETETKTRDQEDDESKKTSN